MRQGVKAAILPLTASHFWVIRACPVLPLHRVFTALTLQRRKQEQKSTWLCRGVTPGGDSRVGVLVCSSPSLCLGTGDAKGPGGPGGPVRGREDAARSGLAPSPGIHLRSSPFPFGARFDSYSATGPRDRDSAPNFREAALFKAVGSHAGPPEAPPPLPQPALRPPRPQQLHFYHLARRGAVTSAGPLTPHEGASLRPGELNWFSQSHSSLYIPNTVLGTVTIILMTITPQPLGTWTTGPGDLHF